jgi:HEPN domain-containing protein
MSGPTVVEAGAHDADELLARLRAGERLVVKADVMGSERELTLRYDGETYYCDTPTRLHKHETAEEMVECMREYGYVSDA